MNDLLSCITTWSQQLLACNTTHQLHQIMMCAWCLQNTMYQIYPKVDEWACRAMDIEGGGGPTAQQSRRHLLAERPQLTLVPHLSHPP